MLNNSWNSKRNLHKICVDDVCNQLMKLPTANRENLSDSDYAKAFNILSDFVGMHAEQKRKALHTVQCEIQSQQPFSKEGITERTGLSIAVDEICWKLS
jgi:hypothetical protein